MTKFETGDPVHIRYKGKETDGEVLMASPNGVSLALIFDARLGGYLGMMPVLWDGKIFRDLIDETPVEIFHAGKSEQGEMKNGSLANHKSNRQTTRRRNPQA